MRSILKKKLMIGLFVLIALPISHAQQRVAVSAKPLGDITQTTTGKAPAQVLASNQSIIAAEVNSVILQVNFDVGDKIKKGDRLVQLEARDFELQLAQTKANLAAQEARIRRGEVRLKRAQELAQEKFVSDDELLERQTDLDVLRADRQVVSVSVAAAKRELEKTSIQAPFDGVVLTRESQVGAFVNLGTPLLTLAETGKPRLIAQISSSDVASVRLGQNMQFRTEQGSWPVTLVEIAGVLDNRSRVQSARFRFSKERPLIGSSGYLVWTRPENVVPADLVVRRDGYLGVFSIEAGKAVFYPLPNAQEGRPAVVDLADDTLIIVEGQQRLQNGDQVTHKT